MAGRGVISNKIVLEGEQEYKQALKAIGSAQKELNSEMKLATSEFRGQANSIDALAKKHEILTKQLNTAQEKLELYAKQHEKAAEARDKAVSRMEEASEAYKKQEQAVNELAETHGKESEEYKKAEEELNRLGQSLETASSGYYEAQKKVNDFATYQNNAQTAVNNLNHELQENDKYLDEAKTSTDGTAKSIDEFGNEVNDANQKLLTFGDIVKANLVSEAIVAGIKKLAEGIKTAATAAFDMGSAFESSMSQVEAVSGATGSDLQALTDKAKQMGATTMFSASQAADAFNYMAMAGWKTTDMLNGIEGIMNLAAASGADLATTSDIVTDALSAFGLKAADSAHFADVLAAASSNANTNVEMMGETFKYAAPVAGALGFSVEDTANAIGLMANAGIKASQAGTSLRAIMNSLSGEIKISGEAMGDVVIQTTNADGSMRDLNDILGDCRTAFSHLSESEQAQAASTLVGKNAMSGFLAIMNAAPEDVEKLTEALNNCDGAAERMAATMQDNLKGDITILQSSLEGLGIAFYDAFSDEAREGVQGATRAISDLTREVEAGNIGVSLERMSKALGEFGTAAIEAGTDALPMLIDALTWILDNADFVAASVAGIATAHVTFTTVIPTLKALHAAWTGVQAAEEGAAVAQGALNAVMNANPAVLLISALAGLAVVCGTMALSNARAAKEMDRLAESMEKGREAVEDLRKANEQQLQGVKDSLKAVKDLNSEEELSTEQKERLALAVARLNEAYPDLNLQIGENGRLTESSTQAINEQSDALETNLELQQKREELSAMLQQLEQDERAYKEAIEEVAEAEQKAAEANNIIYGSGNAAQKRADEAKAAAEEIGAALEEERAQVAATQAEYDALQGKATALAEEQSAAAGSIGASSEEMREKIQEMVQAVSESFTGFDSLMDQISTDVEQTAAQMTENTQHNTEAIKNYSQDLADVTSSDYYQSNQAFHQMVDDIVQKGSSGAAELSEVARAMREAMSQTGDPTEFQNMISSYEELLSAQDNLKTILDAWGQDIENGTNTVKEKWEGMNTESLEIVEKGQEEIQKSLEDAKKDIVTVAEETPKEMGEAISSNESLATDAMELVAENTVKVATEKMAPKEFQSIGEKAMKALAEGITKGGSVVTKALQTAMQTAVNSMDVSGFAAKIDRALGAAMSK